MRIILETEGKFGKHYGAGNTHLLKKLVKRIFVWGFLLSVLFTIIYILFKDVIIHLLTDNEVIINSARPYVFWVSIIPLASFAGFLWDGIYIGTTASKPMRNTMLISAFTIFFPVYYLFVDKMNNHALWLAMILFLLARSISQTIYAKKAVFVANC